MTDTPADPRDVVIEPPPATVYAKAGLAAVVVMRASGVVEKLSAEGASTQEIVEAIRRESPEVVDTVPHGWTLHQWVVVILMVVGVAFQAYEAAHPQAPPSPEEIARIVEDALSKQRPAPPTSSEEEPEPRAGSGAQAEPQ